MNLRVLLLALPLFTLFLMPACADDTGAEGDSDDTGADEGGTTDKGIVTEDQGDGSHISVVDARNETAFTYFDLETSSKVEPSDDNWDLGFLRFNVATHVEVAVLEGTSFDALTQAPADGYVVDASDPMTAMQETMPGYSFDLWYDYNQSNHVLTARTDILYVVHTPEDNYFKVQMQGYYDEAGTSGYLSLHWAPLTPPA